MCDIFSLAKRLGEETVVPFEFDQIDRCLYYPTKEEPINAVKESSELGQFYLKMPFSALTLSSEAVIAALKKTYEENKDKVDSYIASLTECEKKEVSSSGENKDKEDINHPERYGGDTQTKIKEITSAMQDLLLYKNEKYGDSALKPLGIFTKHLRGAEENIASILVRLDDKLGRVKNADELRVNDICDLIGYLTLLNIALGVKPEDIAKFKD